MKLYILPYKIASQSARLLASALNVVRLKKDSPARINAGTTVVNWGTPQVPAIKYTAASIINNFGAVEVASNKLATLNALIAAGIPVPEFTTDKNLAETWVAQGMPVLARKLLRGSAGAGIVGPLNTGDIIPDAPMYVKYIKKITEYRVHVMHVNFLVYEKKKRIGAEVNYHVRSHENGWVFCSVPDDSPMRVRLNELAGLTTRCLGLDFGAVDIIYNARYNNLYVLEVNTAPGIQNQATLKFYVDNIKQLTQGI